MNNEDGRRYMAHEQAAYERGLADGRRLGIEEMRDELLPRLKVIKIVLPMVGNAWLSGALKSWAHEVETALRAPGVAQEAFDRSRGMWGTPKDEKGSEGPKNGKEGG